MHHIAAPPTIYVGSISNDDATSIHVISTGNKSLIVTVPILGVLTGHCDDTYPLFHKDSGGEGQVKSERMQNHVTRGEWSHNFQLINEALRVRPVLHWSWIIMSAVAFVMIISIIFTSRSNSVLGFTCTDSCNILWLPFGFLALALCLGAIVHFTVRSQLRAVLDSINAVHFNRTPSSQWSLQTRGVGRRPRRDVIGVELYGLDIIATTTSDPSPLISV